MFRMLGREEVVEFRPIYHQTTPWPNPIIESVLYDDARPDLGSVHVLGDPRDTNYVITHRSGFTYVHLHPDGIGADEEVLPALDAYMQAAPAFRDYLMFYPMPAAFMEHLKAQDKQFLKVRPRCKYRIDRRRFDAMDNAIYNVPEGHRMLGLVEAGADVLGRFDHKLNERFYDSWDDFLGNSFGVVLLDGNGVPVCLSYAMCTVGHIADIDLITLPDHRNKGYGALTVTHMVRECHRRHLDAHWDCFTANHTDKLVREVYGVERIHVAYDMVTYLSRPPRA